MSRYRAPRPPSSAVITPEGYERLTAELKQLWQVERPEVTQKVSEAAAQGDRSENADYIYGKKRLREIDGRVRYLSKRLEAVTVVDRAPTDPSKIFFGAWVTLIDEAGDQRSYRIVGPDEIDPAKHYISIDAPVARAMLKREVGDEVEVGDALCEIIEIRYETSS